MPRVNVSLNLEDYQKLSAEARKNGRSDSAQLVILAGFTPVPSGPRRESSGKLRAKEPANG